MSQPPGYQQVPSGPPGQRPGWVPGANSAGGPNGGYGYPPVGGYRPPGPGQAGPWSGLPGPPPGFPSPARSGAGITLIVTLQVVAPVLLVLGLSIPEDDTVAWSKYLAWAIFAVVMATVPLLATPLARSTGSTERAWQITALATAGLVGYWLIVVLPGVTSNTGFLQTLGVGCAGGATWLLSQRRTRP